MNQEVANYIVVLPGNAHPIKAEGLSRSAAYEEAEDAVAHGAPEAHVYIRTAVRKRESVVGTWVPVKGLPESFEEWAKSPEAREIQ